MSIEAKGRAKEGIESLQKSDVTLSGVVCVGEFALNCDF